MGKWFDAAVAWGIDHRWLAIVVMVLLTVVSALGFYDEKILLDLFKGKPTKVEKREATSKSKNASKEELPTVNPVRLDRFDAVIAIECDQLFDPETISALRKVVDQLEDLDQVEAIMWLDRIPPINMFGLLQPVLPREKAPLAVFKSAKDRAMAHPLVGGHLLSEDGKTTMLLLNLNRFYLFQDELITADLRKSIDSTLESFPNLEMNYWVTGAVPGSIATIGQHESNQIKFQVIGYISVFILSLILFRGIQAVIIVALAPILGTFWAMGIIQYFEYNRNGLIDVVVPVLIGMVALTDGVHLMVHIRKLRAAGLSPIEAARGGTEKVGLACFLTSLTTTIAFGSLNFADSTTVQEFGKCSVVGIILTFLAVITVIPMACSSRLGKNIHRGLEKSVIDKNLAKINPFIQRILKQPGLFSLMGIGMTLLFIVISVSKLEPDYRIRYSMPPKHEATLGFDHLEKALKGIEFTTIRIDWPKNMDPKDPAIYQVVAKVDDLLDTEELASHPLSIRNLIDSLPGSGPPQERMTLLELLPAELKRAFYIPERRIATVLFRIQDVGIAAYGPVFTRLEAELKKIEQQHPGMKLELKGFAVWRWKHLYQIVVDLAKSLGVAALIIFAVIAIVFRSLRIGLISFVPNLFPLSVAALWLALSGHNLEITMVCSFTVCLGIAVDDTIHFLTRYHYETQNNTAGLDAKEVISKAFTGVGSALIMTTVILVIAFSTLLFSETRDHRIFGVMGALTIASALFADLVFLPAMLKWFVGDRKV